MNGTATGRARAELGRRFGLDAFEYEVPRSARRLSHNLGELALASFALLMLTGFVLELQYRPQPSMAYRATASWSSGDGIYAFCYGLHHWAARAMVLLLAAHLVRVFVSGAFKGGREGTWTLGVLLLLTTGAIFFTGTTLRWDQNSAEAVARATAAAGRLGLGGAVFGGGEAASLARMHALHTSLIPIGVVLLLVAHLLLVKRHGIAPSPFEHPEALRRTEPFTHNRRRSAGFVLLLLSLLIALAVLVPPHPGAPAGAAATTTRPAAPFLWLNALGRLIGPLGVLAGIGAICLALLAVPLLDRGAAQHPRERGTAIAVAAAIAVAICAATLWAAIAPL